MTPETPREKIMIYEMLSDLKLYMEKNPYRMFGIFPCTDAVSTEDIKMWINNKVDLMEGIA